MNVQRRHHTEEKDDKSVWNANPMEGNLNVPDLDLKQAWENKKLEKGCLSFLNSPEISAIFIPNGRLKTNGTAVNKEIRSFNEVSNCHCSSCVMPVIQEELYNMSYKNFFQLRKNRKQDNKSSYSYATERIIRDQNRRQKHSRRSCSMNALETSFEQLSTKDGSCIINNVSSTSRPKSYTTTGLSLPHHNLSNSLRLSPYDRCRSSAVCGRSCVICHGSNVNTKIRPSASTEYDLLSTTETVYSSDSGNFSLDHTCSDTKAGSLPSRSTPEYRLGVSSHQNYQDGIKWSQRSPDILDLAKNRSESISDHFSLNNYTKSNTSKDSTESQLNSSPDQFSLYGNRNGNTEVRALRNTPKYQVSISPNHSDVEKETFPRTSRVMPESRMVFTADNFSLNGKTESHIGLSRDTIKSTTLFDNVSCKEKMTYTNPTGLEGRNIQQDTEPIDLLFDSFDLIATEDQSISASDIVSFADDIIGANEAEFDNVLLRSEPHHDKLLRDFDFVAIGDFQSDDTTVFKGESVMLLSDEKDNWAWILTERGEEGYMPRHILKRQACHCEGKKNCYLLFMFASVLRNAISRSRLFSMFLLLPVTVTFFILRISIVRTSRLR